MCTSHITLDHLDTQRQSVGETTVEYSEGQELKRVSITLNRAEIWVMQRTDGSWLQQVYLPGENGLDFFYGEFQELPDELVQYTDSLIYDIPTTILHELGHWLGLGIGSGFGDEHLYDPSQVMYLYYNGPKHLGNLDLLCIEEAYPTLSNLTR
jgi:hypothetical protein